jgi:hypothetical protein
MNMTDNRLVVCAFGRTNEGVVINAKITGFKPSFLLKLEGKQNMQKFNGIVKDISRTHAGKSGNVGTVVQRKDFMYYSECEKRFLKVSFNNIRDFVATRSRFNKNADMKGSLYDSKNPPFLQLIHARDLPTSAWIQLENFTEDVDAIDNRKTVTVDWEDVNGAPTLLRPWLR